MPVHEMLRGATVSAVRVPPRFSHLAFQRELLSLGVASKLDYSLLKFDISGMFSPYGDSSNSVLSALVVDRMFWLEHSKHSILKSLSVAGFVTIAVC